MTLSTNQTSEHGSGPESKRRRILTISLVVGAGLVVIAMFALLGPGTRQFDQPLVYYQVKRADLDITITERVFEGLEARAEQPVLVDGPTGKTLTGAALKDRIKRFAGGLAQSGHAGETIAITIERDGWRKTVELKLTAAPDAPSGAEAHSHEHRSSE